MEQTEACQPQQIIGADGARISCCAHGGQLLEWVPAGRDADRLWTSPLWECGPGVGIRGGVPVVFPQFSARGPLPKHGFVRDRPWEPVPVDSDEARWSARLRSDDDTMQIWPHAFTLRVDVGAVGDSLTIKLSVRNDGHAEFKFAAALHNYLRVADAAATTVEGLGELPAEDNAQDAAPTMLPAGPLVAVAARDVAVRGVPGPVLISDPVLGTLQVTATGFPDRVIWNPGPRPGISDIPDGGETEFFCLEPAVLTPQRLAPGAVWSGQMVLTASA